MVDCRSHRGFLKSCGWLIVDDFFVPIEIFLGNCWIFLILRYARLCTVWPKVCEHQIQLLSCGINFSQIGVRQDNIHEIKFKSWMRGATCMVTHNYLNIRGDSFCDANLSVTTIEQS